jgi:hypothetical protein
MLIVLSLMLLACGAAAQTGGDFPEKKKPTERKEFNFIGYFFTRSEASDFATTNEFLKGQVVGRLFGGNTSRTSDRTTVFTEQRFMPMITYSPRLFDGWAKIRTSLEFDWTWGDTNYNAAGNQGGAFGADNVNMQTQNLFMEFRPKRNLFVNVGLQRIYDNALVPWYTPTDFLLHQGYRLALFASDGTGVSTHWFRKADERIKVGAYQLYENNIDQDDDVVMFEGVWEKDLAIDSTVGLAFNYLRDHANGEGGVVSLGQGLNSGLNNYNGTFNFDFGNEAYTADVFWAGLQFHKNPLLRQGRLGVSGFAFYNFGEASTDSRSVDISGVAGNLRTAWRYGRCAEDQVVFDAVFTTGDGNGISDGTYNGVLTGNNWTTPGAVFIGTGMYLLMPHGNVVNRYRAAVIDIQNMGYGLTAGALTVARDLVQNKVRIKGGAGMGFATKTAKGMDNMIGTELNMSLRYRPKVFLDLELHAAYMWLGSFYESPVANGTAFADGRQIRQDVPISYERPKDPWTVMATIKWIMF